MTADIVKFATVGGLMIAYQFFGNPDGHRVILVTGFGDQMTEWPQSLIDGLVAANCHVLVYDTRDSGLSDSYPDGAIHEASKIIGAAMGEDSVSDYNLDDLAEELLGLIDELDFSGAHLIGYSMGGMVIQRAALRRPDFGSLTLLFTSSGAHHLSQGSPESTFASLAMTQPMRETERVQAGVAFIKVTNGKVFGKSDTEAHHEIEASQMRAYRPDGVGRMMMALLSSPPVYDKLCEIKLPVLILSAEDDCFFGPDHAADLIQRIPHAELIEIAGSGHNLPEAVGEEVARLWLAQQEKHNRECNA
jgi:pimeloyl-ACP methyl ester carboxylesterase